MIIHLPRHLCRGYGKNEKKLGLEPFERIFYKTFFFLNSHKDHSLTEFCPLDSASEQSLVQTRIDDSVNNFEFNYDESCSVKIS